MSRRMFAAAGASAAVAGAAAWWFTDSAPYPYAQRKLLDLPLPFLSNTRLEAVLGPRPGERVLEIRPGTGLQSEMLDCVNGDARARRGHPGEAS